LIEREREREKLKSVKLKFVKKEVKKEALHLKLLKKVFKL
jgi:hypothetical protein